MSKLYLHIISYKDAKEKGLRHFYTGRPCKHGHDSERLVTNRSCRICQRKNSRKAGKKWFPKNKEKFVQYSTEYAQRYPELVKEKRHQRYLDNKDEVLRKSKQWVENNREHWNAYLRERGTHVYSQNRRARELQATVAWADTEVLRTIYQESYQTTQATGVKHEVDHIVPLQSDVVCGLHCPDNLRIITRKENREKSNHLYEDVHELFSWVDDQN